MGYRVLEAPRGREAIRIAEGRIPNPMLLDSTLPDLSGFELLREIRYPKQALDAKETSDELRKIHYVAGIG